MDSRAARRRVADRLGLHGLAAAGRGGPARWPTVRRALGLCRPVRVRVPAGDLRCRRHPRPGDRDGWSHHRRRRHGVAGPRPARHRPPVRAGARDPDGEGPPPQRAPGGPAPVRRDGPADRSRRCGHRPIPGVDRRQLRRSRTRSRRWSSDPASCHARSADDSVRRPAAGRWSTSRRSASTRRGGSSSRARLGVDEVGFSVGYQDPTFFRRLFKRMTGTDPGRVPPKVRDDRSVRGAIVVRGPGRPRGGLTRPDRSREWPICPDSMRFATGRPIRPAGDSLPSTVIQRRRHHVTALIPAHRPDPEPRGDARGTHGLSGGRRIEDPGRRHAHPRYGPGLYSTTPRRSRPTP